MQDAQTDLVVIGGGIVGLATAYQASRFSPDWRIAVLEKEQAVCRHQSGRNSGVIHSGIYYAPGSIKATTCREGKAMLEAFCQEYQVPFDRCGKIIVATSDDEVEGLERIYQRGIANGVDCRRIDRKEMVEIEPHVGGLQGLHVPETGIVDYPMACRRMADDLKSRGHQVILSAEVRQVRRFDGMYELQWPQGKLRARYLVNCAGLHSDRVMKLCGIQPPARIVPFRGEYFELSASSQHLCRHLIYPVPNPEFPFLGVHFTRMIGGGVECGPNAVLALAREGYDWRTIRARDLYDSLTYSGFLRLAARYWRTGAGEIKRSLSKQAFVKALQVLVPEIRAEHLKWAPAGVRAQAIAADGKMVDDFLFADAEKAVHVCNAPSPAATASLKIGETIARRILKHAG